MPDIHVTELPSLKGKDLGSSRWFEVTQEQISTFATLTGDEGAGRLIRFQGCDLRPPTDAPGGHP